MFLFVVSCFFLYGVTALVITAFYSSEYKKEFLVNINERKFMIKEKGFIYILSNPSFGNLYKVGMTTRDPYERAEELSELTAIPTPFKVEYSAYVEDCSVTEALTHKILQERGYRVAENREYFNAPLQEIKKIISRVKKPPVIPRAKQFKKQIKKFRR
jgi:hypothetical protein